MIDSTLWLVIVTVGAGTYALRASFIARGGDRAAPPAYERFVRHVPTAALVALVTSTAVASHGGGGDAPLRLVALAAAAGVAALTRSVLLTLAAGMGALWLLQWAW